MKTCIAKAGYVFIPNFVGPVVRSTHLLEQEAGKLPIENGPRNLFSH